MHSLNVGLYGSGPSKPAAQTSLDQIPRIGPPTETYDHRLIQLFS